jgi:hypothetical protein
MNIVYVLPYASLCGGCKVISEHVSGLNRRGHTAEVWGLSGNFNWFRKPVSHRTFRSTDELGAALKASDAKKVATFWTTAEWVHNTLKEGQKGYYLIQDEDELTYSGSTKGTSYRRGLVPITESEFVTQEIDRKYHIGCTNVGIGIDHEIFYHMPMPRERFRVFTPFRTTSAGPANLKGFDITLEVLRRLSAVEPRASVVTFGMEASPSIDFMPHIHVRNPSDDKLRELYSQAGVFLSCSRHEGFGLPQLEAMACGCPTVSRDSHGNREYAREASVFTDDVNEMVYGIRQIMMDTTEFLKWQSLALEAVKRYRWEKVIDNLEKVFAD